MTPQNVACQTPISFTVSWNFLRIMSIDLMMLSNHHKRRLCTWTSPCGQHQNQIAYILCSQRWRRFIQPWAPKSLQMVPAAMKLKDTCSLEEKLGSILKSRDITLPTKIHLLKTIVFPVVMYGCESWTMKKAEHKRINVF